MTKHQRKRSSSPKLVDPPGTFREVLDNPYRGTQDEHPTVNVLKRTASDHMGAMHARKQIDATQLAAARKVERWLSITSMAGCHGVDPTREYVDTSGGGDVMTTEVLDAHMHLDACNHALGSTRWHFARAVIAGEGTIRSLAWRIVKVAPGMEWSPGRGVEVEAGRTFRACLDDLAHVFKLA